MTKNEVLEIMEMVCRAGAAHTTGYDPIPDNPLVPVQGNCPIGEYLEMCADWAENELRK